MADIFVSYASEDRERVRSLVAVFEERGWSVWWDDALGVGPSFDDEIEKALDAARCVVVVWSHHSVRKRWVRAEAAEGLERDVLVPLLIDDTRPPLVFRTSQTAKLFDWPERSGEVDAVTLAITELLGRVDVTENANVSPQTLTSIKSVAVLPFVNISPDPNQEYLADGITEDLIDHLGRNRSLRVIARTSCFYFKDRPDDVRKIGRRLGVGHIVEGSVRRVGNKIRVTAQLVRTSDGGREWSGRYDRELDDIFAVQDDINGEVTRQLTDHLSRPASLYRPSTQAYEQFLKGQAWLRRVSFQGSTRARPFFQAAVNADRRYADAHAAMAKAYMNERLFSYSHAREALDHAADHVEKALLLNPDHSAALLQKSVILAQRDYDIQGAINGLQLVQKKEPDRYETLDAAAIVYDYAGRADLVEQVAKQLIRIDPVGVVGYLLLQVVQMSQGRFLEAQDTLQQLLAIEPEHQLTLANMADLMARQGNVDAALALIEDHGLHQYGQACFVYAAAGRTREVEEVIGVLERRSGLKVFLTHAYALLGNLSGVQRSLRQAIENRDPSLSHLTGQGVYHNCTNVHGVALATIYEGSAVQALLREVGLDQESIGRLQI